MPSDPQIINAIIGVLGNAASPAVTTSMAACDSFELFIFSILIQAARRSGADVTYHNIGQTIFDGQFTFRSSPGRLYSTRHPYTFARLSFANHDPLEVHIGIYTTGDSKVEHECDLAVVDFTEAENCRRQRVHPRRNKIVVATECKFYSSASFGIDLGRSFLGLCTDIGTKNRFFVANTNSDSLEALLSHHNGAWDKKREMILEHSALNLNRSFQNVHQWNETLIAERSKELLKHALKLWPRP